MAVKINLRADMLALAAEVARLGHVTPENHAQFSKVLFAFGEAYHLDSKYDVRRYPYICYGCGRTTADVAPMKNVVRPNPVRSAEELAKEIEYQDATHFRSAEIEGELSIDPSQGDAVPRARNPKK